MLSVDNAADVDFCPNWQFLGGFICASCRKSLQMFPPLCNRDSVNSAGSQSVSLILTGVSTQPAFVVSSHMFLPLPN